jgi:hypothetical protein
MIAIYKRELKSFFHTFVGWLFLAVTLFLMGIYFTVYNMLAGYPTISYVLQSIVFLYIITIPILTMRVLSEDRKKQNRSDDPDRAGFGWQDCDGKIFGAGDNTGYTYRYHWIGPSCPDAGR